MESGPQPAVEPVVSLMSTNMAMMTMMKKRKETRRNQRILEIFQVNSWVIFNFVVDWPNVGGFFSNFMEDFENSLILPFFKSHKHY